MSFTFTKLFSSITESTVWCEPNHVRICWITMLAMADKQGRVFGSVPGLAKRAQLTVDEVLESLAVFESPDAYSRTKDHDGRRVEALDGGWRLLNHAKYRAIRDAEDRRAYKAEHEAKRRKSKTVDKFVDKMDKCGPRGPEMDTNGHIAEAEAEADTKTSTNTLASTANAVPAAKLLGTLPLNDGTSYEVREDAAREWQSLYPATDVMQELRNMKGWLISHPENRKTKKGILRFITAWLAKEQDRAKPTGGKNGTFKGKTERSIDAAHEAIALIRQAESDRNSAEQDGREEAGEAGDGGLSGVRGGSSAARPEAHSLGSRQHVIEAAP